MCMNVFMNAFNDLFMYIFILKNEKKKTKTSNHHHKKKI